MSDNPKFTPGPWEVVHTDDNSYMTMTVITPKGLFPSGETFGMLSNEPCEKLGKVIAITFHQLEPIAGYEACENDEDDGNAYLMAAAPDMHEALSEVIAVFESLHPMNPEEPCVIYDIWHKAKQALVKAQGGETMVHPHE